MRVAKATIGVVVLGSLLFSGASAFAAAAPAGGTIKVFGTPGGSNGSAGTVVITGAIGDYGKSVKASSAGKPTKNGKDTLLVLKKGTILIDATQVQSALQSVASPPADFNDVTCSASAVASDVAVPIVSGTKAYAGITGSVTVNLTFAFFGPLKSSGKCDDSGNANPTAEFGSIVGQGTVSFG